MATKATPIEDPPVPATLEEVAGDYPALSASADDLMEIMSANVGGSLSEFDLDRVRIPAGGGKHWSVPTLEGEEEVTTVEGIVVHWKEPRAYWKVSFDESGGGSPPDCTARDGVHGVGEFGPGSEHNPHGLCDTCPMSKWGTARGGEGKGQACKQMRVLFLARPGDFLPIAVTMPPTSIKPIRQYFLRLASKQMPYYGVVTKLELEGATNAQGIKYSKAKPRIAKVLEPSVAQQIRSYGDAIRANLDAVTIDVDAVRSDPTE